MQSKEIRKLHKRQLLLMLRKQEQEIADLQSQNQALIKRMEQMRVDSSQYGSLEEKAVKLSGILTEAQAAADDYLCEIKKRRKGMEQEMEIMVSQTREKCKRMEIESQKKAELAWQYVQKQLENYLQSHSELKELLKVNAQFFS